MPRESTFPARPALSAWTSKAIGLRRPLMYRPRRISLNLRPRSVAGWRLAGGVPGKGVRPVEGERRPTAHTARAKQLASAGAVATAPHPPADHRAAAAAD